MVIDAADFCVGRSINSNFKTGKKPNVAFFQKIGFEKTLKDFDNVFFQAINDIKAEEELLVDYGSDYFEDHFLNN